MIRFPSLAALACLAALSAAVAGTSAAATAPAARAVSPDRGSPGHWTKVSSGTVDFAAESSLVRGGNGDLHVAYARDFADGSVGLSHTAIRADGAIRSRSLIQPGWQKMDYTPALVRSSLGLRVLFGGQIDSQTTFFDQHRIYNATSDDSGTSWTLPLEGVSNVGDDADSSSGTGAVTLADGTPVVAFTANGTLTWHVGTDASVDHTYTPPSGTSLYNTSVVRDGSDVWAAWFQVGQDAATTGTFAMKILPIPLSPAPLKAPGSSNGTQVTHPDSRVALAARAGGGVYTAYCVGYPTCSSLRLWRVGTSTTVTVPHSRSATRVSLSPGPSGRLWVAWADGAQKIRAVRTGRGGMAMGAVRSAGQANGVKEVNSLSVEGSNGRGDIVVNVFGALLHTQVLPGLTLHASPSRWRHGSRQRVMFSVTDAHDPVRGSRVSVRHSACRTDGTGHCTITFSGSLASGKYRASARKSGHGRATATLRVR